MKASAVVAGLMLSWPGLALAGEGASFGTPDLWPSRVQGADISGLLQVDWVMWRQSSVDELDPSTREPLNEETFSLRRGLLRLDAAETWAAGRLEAEASSVAGFSFRPRQAWVGLRPEPQWLAGVDALALVGLIPIPFGGEIQELLTAMPWLERTTMARAFFPGQHDFGAGVALSYRVLRLSVAFMNGEPSGGGQYFGEDPNSAKDFVGRTGVELPLSSSQTLGFGFSCLSGEGLHEGTTATKDRLSWRDNNENGLVEVSELSVLAGAPATPSREFSRFALGMDARLVFETPHLGKAVVRAEVVRALNLDRGIEPADPVARGRDLRELGFSIGVSQELLQRFELGVRYDEYDPDNDASRYQGARVVPLDASYSTWAFAASVRLESARFLVEYDHRDNHLGRDESGKPTTLLDDSLTLRGELLLP